MNIEPGYYIFRLVLNYKDNSVEVFYSQVYYLKDYETMKTAREACKKAQEIIKGGKVVDVKLVTESYWHY